MRTPLTFVLTGLLAMLLFSFPRTVEAAWLWGSDTLVTIDGQRYSTDEFRSWWKNWREKDQPLPSTPQPFIDWIVEYREAERMKLYEDPLYRRKVMTFLKARALMMLKAEAVDSRITINEHELKARYRREYVPRYYLHVLRFPDQEAAENLLKKIGSDLIDEARLQELAQDGKNKMTLQSLWVRPPQDPELKAALQGVPVGGHSQVLKRHGGSVVLVVAKVDQGSDEDFARVRPRIRRKLWQEQEDRLTVELLKKLREKYKVHIDEDRLETLDIDAPLDSFSDDDILITTSRGSISARQFMIQIQNQRRFREKNGFAPEDPGRLKARVLSGIIDQTLTTWESLDRGYEKKPPFRDDYLFYCRHHLIMNLEKRVLTGTDTIDRQQIEQYYQQHIKEFTKPEMVRMVIVEGSRKELQALWAEAVTGGDLRKLAAERFGHQVPVREVPADHLDPVVRKVVSSLTPGELSPIFAVKGHVSLLQLLQLIPASPAPLERVEKRIRQILSRQRQEEQRQAFLAKLRAQSSITVDEKAWRQLKQQLEQEDGDN